MRQADAAQICAQLTEMLRSDQRQTIVALQAEPEWSGPDVIDGPDKPARIVPCGSPLAVREAMLHHDDAGDELLVLLTTCPTSELGLDVQSRLLKGQVVPFDPHASLLALFQATILDPQLANERWLIEDLIELAPRGGWPTRRSLNGVLDIETAWSTWLGVRLGLEQSPNSVDDLLLLGQRDDVRGALHELPEEARQRLALRWATGLAGPEPVILDLLASGNGDDVIALGLVAQAVWTTSLDASMEEEQRVARARLEMVFGRDRMSAAAADRWGKAAVTALGEGYVSEHLDMAEKILATAGATDLARLSDVLPSGFDSRVSAFGSALSRRDATVALQQLRSICQHRLAARRRPRVEMAEAAMRLLQRSLLPEKVEPTTFAASVVDYVEDGSWLDEASSRLVEGDHVPEAALAYSQLAESAISEKIARSQEFANALAEWSMSEPLPSDDFVTVERLLDDVVAPVAKAAPVLLVLCDGMSLPVAHELIRDLLEEGWGHAVPANGDVWPCGVATLPTVTQVSRTSLFTGTRISGGQGEERSGFAAHLALRAASSAALPPVLLHKGGLIAPSGQALPDDVRSIVADPDQRVVGVVVNSVDDHLARGDQVRVGWNLESLKPLYWLLDAAAEAGRVVVLTADHGHVLQGTDSIVRQLPSGGERWRLTPPEVGEGEIEISGPRVLLGNGRLVMPTDHRLRYAGYKHGYHGGATPEEVLVPIEVLARRLPEGWRYKPADQPAWWSLEYETRDEPAAPKPLAAAKSKLTSVVSSGQQSIFANESDTQQASTTADRLSWVDALLQSPEFVANRQRVRLPRPISDDRLTRYLSAIYESGGEIHMATLATLTGEPADTLRMALALVQRLLNLDGAEILAVRSDGTIHLNYGLVEMQFEVKKP